MERAKASTAYETWAQAVCFNQIKEEQKKFLFLFDLKLPVSTLILVRSKPQHDNRTHLLLNQIRFFILKYLSSTLSAKIVVQWDKSIAIATRSWNLVLILSNRMDQFRMLSQMWLMLISTTRFVA